MAVGTPIAGTVAGSNGGLLQPNVLAGQNVVANDIVFIPALFYANSGTVPTVITWPTGDATFPTWTQVRAVAIKDASGVTKGIAGWAWARATTSFTGTRDVSSNGTTGASSGGIAQIIKVPGCYTGGDPYEDEQVNNPNYTTTVDWPACTMSRSTGGGSIIFILNSDNVNVSDPVNWTSLVSNASSQGLDSAFDCNYRLPGATGTYDPANLTMGATQGFGWAAFHVMFTDTAPATAPGMVWPPPSRKTIHIIRR